MEALGTVRGPGATEIPLVAIWVSENGVLRYTPRWPSFYVDDKLANSGDAYGLKPVKTYLARYLGG